MARQSRSHVKSMLIIFFDCKGGVHYEFAPRGQTINKEYYVKVLKRLRDAVRRKRPRFWSSSVCILHHDNAPAHSSNLVQQFLAKHKIVQLRQPPYSPDIAPWDFWMFLKLKMALKGKQFDRRFIKRFSEISTPLNQLLKKNMKLNWTNKQQEAFDTLKEKLCEEPLLQRSDFSKPFILTTDASGYAIGGILFQG